MSNDIRLNSIRNKIDEIDIKLQELISERAMLAKKVFDIKKNDLKTDEVFCPEREVDVLEHVSKYNQGPLSNEHLCSVFSEIIAVCRNIQKETSVGYLGPKGTFSHLALIKHFGKTINAVSVTQIDEIFRDILNNHIDFGIIPIENSIGGSVDYSLDCLMKYNISVCGEIELPVHQCLFSSQNSLDKINKIYSHLQSLAQCRQWLSTHLPNVLQVPVSSNTEGAILAAKESNSAAIAAKIAGDIYKLNLLEENIEDITDNTTRFIIISRKCFPKMTGRDKTSFLIKCSNKTGALLDILKSFNKYKVNLTKIESRPLREVKWEYMFFIDAIGHVNQDEMEQVLKELEDHNFMVKKLGSYPMAIRSKIT